MADRNSYAYEVPEVDVSVIWENGGFVVRGFRPKVEIPAKSVADLGGA